MPLYPGAAGSMRSTTSCSGSDWRRHCDGVLLDARVVEVVLLVTRPRRSAPAGARPAQDARPAGVSAATLPAAGVGCWASSSSVDPRHAVDGDHAPQVVVEILIDLIAVAPRQEDTAQPAAVRGQHLLGRCRRPGAPVRRG